MIVSALVKRRVQRKAVSILRFVLALWVISLCGLLQSQEITIDNLRRLIEHSKVESASEISAFQFNASAYDSDTCNLPIGVFDSGIGGLTVLEAILGLDQFNNQTLQPLPDGKPDFENEKFIYFGDQANMPYGNYASAGKEEYLRELILKDTVFLLGNRFWKSNVDNKPQFDKLPVKAIVIACNTATAYGLEDVKLALQAWKVPVFVVGVVEAGARGVLESQSSTDASKSSVAVLATVGTCASNAYPRLIGSTFGSAGRRPPPIIQQGFVELAAAIEGDPSTASKGSISEFINRDVANLVEQHRRSGSTSPISTVILGCTHYPLVQPQIIEAFDRLRSQEENGQKVYSQLIAEKISIVDPAQLTAKELFRSLARNQLRSSTTQSVKQTVNYFISVPNPNCATVQISKDGALDQTYKYSRMPGKLEVEDTLNVPMTSSVLPNTSLNLMQSRLPLVWKSFQANQQ